MEQAVPPPLESAVANYQEGVMDNRRVLEEMDQGMAKDLMMELRSRYVQHQNAQTGGAEGAFPDNDWCDITEFEDRLPENSAVFGSATDEAIVEHSEASEMPTGPCIASMPNGHSMKTLPKLFARPVTMMPRPNAKAKAKAMISLRQGCEVPPTWLGGPSVVDGATSSDRVPKPMQEPQQIQPQIQLWGMGVVWPFGWTTAGQVTAYAIDRDSVSLSSFLSMVKVIEDTVYATAVDFNPREEGAEYYTCTVIGQHGNYKFGVTCRPTKSSVPEYMSLGPRMYLRSVPIPLKKRYQTMLMMITLINRYGRGPRRCHIEDDNGRCQILELWHSETVSDGCSTESF